MKITIKTIALICLFFSFLTIKAQTDLEVSATIDWHNAQWIWQAQDGPNDCWMNFRKTFEITSIPEKAVINIAADSKFWLWINGKLVIREGGLKRGPNPTDSWFDVVSIQEFLKKGTNTIAVQVWYWGKRDNDYYKSYNPSGKGGLIVSGTIGNQLIHTDASWKCKLHPAYGLASVQPNNMKPEPSVLFDAQKDISDWNSNAFKAESWDNAIEKGMPPTVPWGKLHKREVPQWKDEDLTNYTNNTRFKLPFVSNGDAVLAKLPVNYQVYPFIKLDAKAGQKIIIRADDTKEKNLVAEYITKQGLQSFEMPNWINGHVIKYEIEKGVRVLELKYRETQYDTEIVGDFSCNDVFFNTLWKKATRTLVVCLRDTYMDCPDRERAQWWGDVTLQMGAAFYALDRNVDFLSKKAIYDLIGWAKPNGVISSPIPYSNKNNELTTQMLASIGPDGFWLYYKYTGDAAPVVAAYPTAKKYLELWSMGDNGLVEHRKAGWDWGDWGTNIDKPILENCWYYWACKAAIDMARLSGNTQDIDWFRKRVMSIENNFDTVFWNGNEYMSENIWMDKPSIIKGLKPIADERANAMAVVTGLASKDKFSKIAAVLKNNINAGPYMEKYVGQALFMIGESEAALGRLKLRYKVMVDLPESTLYETFPKGGTMNHAWNVPNTLLSEYVAGIAPLTPGFETFQVMPKLGSLTDVKSRMLSAKGMIEVGLQNNKSSFLLSLNSPAQSIAVVGIPKKDSKIVTIKVNGQLVWEVKNGFKNANKAISWNSEDDQYIKFNVAPGKWEFITSNSN